MRRALSRRAAASRTRHRSVRCPLISVRSNRGHSRAVHRKHVGQACQPLRRHPNRRSVFGDAATSYGGFQLRRNSASPHDKKACKVLNYLNFDSIKFDAPTKLKLREIIDEFIDVFAKCDSDVGSTNVVFHEIDTGDSRPLRQPARRIPYGEQRDAVEQEIKKLSENGVARLSTSPWGSPVVMVKMKDGAWRMCVDYRRVNAAIKFDCFSLPRHDKALDAVANCSVFSSLDLAMAYHQVLVAPADVEKTAL